MPSIKRMKALAVKRARKVARMKETGESSSRYARKRRGEIPPEFSGHGQRPLCGRCYLRMCMCNT
jgi:hypothetical protein